MHDLAPGWSLLYCHRICDGLFPRGKNALYLTSYLTSEELTYKISGELEVVLAICSSLVNFAISYSVQPFINVANYGWTFFFFGLCVLASILAAIPLVIFSKRWRTAKAPRYYQFLEEVGGGTD